jgi:polyhydroxyalkanoate synthesis regulator phasin
MEHDRVDEAAFGTSGVETTTTSIPRSRRIDGPARRLILAGIGAVVTALDEAEETYDKFVDRGEQVREEWQGKAEELRHQNEGARYRVRSAFRSAMDAFFDAINVPNKTDVDTINIKLNILTRKVDDLQMSAGREAKPAPGADAPPPSPKSDLAT